MSNINFFLKLRTKDQIIPFALISPHLTIGTARETSITLSPGECEERHCRIERKENNQFIIKDLRSETGTFVNDTRILEAILNPGDILRIGTATFEFTNDAIENKEAQSPFLKSRNLLWKEKLSGIPNFSKTQFPVLILGPSGSGKEVLAKEIHERSHRAQGPFLSVNCSALSENLVESELFGHIKGSFTGAISDRKGAFEAARGGTLFLDEIGDLPYNLQAKLLRALENNEVRAVGADVVTKTDVRIIAATHQNLHQNIEEKRFRADLYYRLNVITILAPSINERIEDFEDIFFSLCKEARVRFSFQAIQDLKNRQWPGNIREIKNVVSRASALYPGQTIDENKISKLIDLPHSFTSSSSTPSVSITPGSIKTNLIKEMEKQMIVNRLIANRGNQRRTANELGMPKSTLHDRIKAYKIDPDNLEVLSESTVL